MNLRTAWWGLRKPDVQKALRDEEWIHQHRLEEYRYEMDQLNGNLERTLDEAASLEEMICRYQAIEKELSVTPEAMGIVERELAATLEFDRREAERRRKDHVLAESLMRGVQHVRHRLRRVEREREEWRQAHSQLLECAEEMRKLISDALASLPMTTEQRTAEPSADSGKHDQSNAHFSELWSMMERYAPHLTLRQPVALPEGIVAPEGTNLSHDLALQAYVTDSLHILLDATDFATRYDLVLDVVERSEGTVERGDGTIASS